MKFNSSLQKLVIESLPNFKGSWLLYSNTLKVLPKRFHTCMIPNNLRLNLTDPAQLSIVKIRKGQHEAGTINFLRKHLQEGDVFVDVGANFGYFSAIAASMVGTSGLVMAFEPNKQAYDNLLSTMIRNNIHNCLPYHLALGETENTAMTMKKRWFRQTTSSFMVSGDDVLSDTFDNVFARLSSHKQIKVIKIDVEGAELPALKGMRHILTSQNPYVIIEPDMNSESRFSFKFDDVIAFMAELGYKPRYSLNPHLPGEILEYYQDTALTQSIVFMKQSHVL